MATSASDELDVLISRVSDNIGHGWMVLARSLGFSDTDIDSIEYKNPRELKEQIYQLFNQWKRREGDNATSGMLYAALYDGELNELLKKLNKIDNVKKRLCGYVRVNLSGCCQAFYLTPAVPDHLPPSIIPPQLNSAILDTNVVPDSTSNTGPHVVPDSTTTTGPHTPPPKRPHTTATEHSPPVVHHSPNISQNNLNTPPHTPETEQEMIRRKRIERLGSNLSNNSDGPGNEDPSTRREHTSIPGAPPPSLVPSGGVNASNLQENAATVPARSVCPFDLDDMVMLERPDAAPWYGVVKWIGELPGQLVQPVVGVEMDDVVPGGSNGSLDGSQHFQCHDGRGLFLPIRMLKKDNRFQNDGSPPPSRRMPQNETSSATLSQLLEELRSPVETTSVLNQASPPSQSSLLDGQESVLVFKLPADRVGIIIGTSGRHIRAVERETGTIIKISDGLGGGDAQVVIRGGDKNKKKALQLILDRLKSQFYEHTAKAETIQIQEDKVGLVIGTKGRTVRAIKKLSGAAIDIKELPPGLKSFSLFGSQTCDCVITGSEEDIEKAKELIRMAEQGGDIVGGATLAALIVDLAKFHITVEEQNNN